MWGGLYIWGGALYLGGFIFGGGLRGVFFGKRNIFGYIFFEKEHFWSHNFWGGMRAGTNANTPPSTCHQHVTYHASGDTYAWVTMRGVSLEQFI